ncbi:MAG: hypothetical protein WA908_12660, partial [Pontixanthobacter sp.]
DLPYLHSHFVLRYEDLVSDPQRWVAALYCYLDLPSEPVVRHVRDGNQDYSDHAALSDAVARTLEKWGYGCTGLVEPFAPIIADPLRDVRENAYRTIPPARDPLANDHTDEKSHSINKHQ